MNLVKQSILNSDPERVGFDEMNSRDETIIHNFLSKYNIKMSYEQLFEFSSIYLFSENIPRVKRFRLLATKKVYPTYTDDVDGGVRTFSDFDISNNPDLTVKVIREQILVINEKKIDSLSIEELSDIVHEVFIFTVAFRQLKLFHEIREDEKTLLNTINGISDIAVEWFDKIIVPLKQDRSNCKITKTPR